MSADVTILAALLAGLVSFLSPCVLPLVPPYLVFLTGASIERLAEGERETQVRRETVIAAALFVAGFSTVFIALGASASVVGAMLRYYSHALSIVAGIAIIIMGLHFLGLTPISLLHRQAPLRRAEAGRLVGRLCHGACVRARLDAVHRPDPGGDPGGRRVRGARSPRAPGCWRSIRWGSAFPSSSQRLRSSRSRPSWRAFAPISDTSNVPWEGSWC